MPRLEVTIMDAIGARKQKASIPDDMSVSRIIERLISMMNLPVQDNSGRPMRYRLDHVERGGRLRDGDTFMSANVKDGDTLRISAETVAGAWPHPPAGLIWR